MRGSQALVLEELARLEWIEKSEVAAFREGVIETMELRIGMPVKKNGVIGVLHHEIAELTVKKNQLQAEGHCPRREGRGPEGSRHFGRRSQHTAERSAAWHGLCGRRGQGRGRVKVAEAPDQGSRRRTGASPRPSWNWRSARWTSTRSWPRSTESCSSG